MGLKSPKLLKIVRRELKKLISLTKSIDFCGRKYYIDSYTTSLKEKQNGNIVREIFKEFKDGRWRIAT